MVARLPHKQNVPGSIPGPATNLQAVSLSTTSRHGVGDSWESACVVVTLIYGRAQKRLG